MDFTSTTPSSTGGNPQAPKRPAGKYSLGEHAENTYDRLVVKRQGIVDMARLMAELTIPSLYPEEGYQPGDNVAGNNQSIGARCVNTLASRLMLMAFPPGRPIMRLKAIQHAMAKELAADPALASALELALSLLEQAHRERLETTTMRSAYTGFIKLLLVAGNGLWVHLDIDNPVFYKPEFPGGGYVVKRTRRGDPRLVILKERVAVEGLDDETKALVEELEPNVAKLPLWEQEVDIYTCQQKHGAGKNSTWCYWQEYKGHLIADTEVETDGDNAPMEAAWLIPNYGEDWGRSYCEEYRGDLYTVENHHSALNDGAAVASLTLMFVKPGARTSLKQVKQAKNLDVLSGTAEDVTILKADKNADYQFVTNNAESAGKRLGFAFLLNSAIQRQGERVTAEEWETMARELDEAMGGVYSELAQGTQRKIVLRFMHLHEEEDGELPPVPEGVVRVSVSTGIDSVGRSAEGAALVRFGKTLIEVFGPEKAAGALVQAEFTRRIAASEGIQTRGLVLEEEAMAAQADGQKQDMMRQTLIEKGAGPLADAAGKAMLNQQQPPSTPTP
jgi:hypothetical protein